MSEQLERILSKLNKDERSLLDHFERAEEHIKKLGSESEQGDAVFRILEEELEKRKTR